MDTDDDIFIIHKRTEAYIHSLMKQRSSLEHKKVDLLHKLLMSKPPHGFSDDIWQQIANHYNMDLILLSTSTPATTRTNTRGSPKRIKSPRNVRLSYKECKDILRQIEHIEQLEEQSRQQDFYEFNSKEIIDRYKQCITHVVYTDFMTPTKVKDISPEQRALRDELIHLVESVFGPEAVEKVVIRKQQSCNSSVTREDIGGDGVIVECTEPEMDDNEEDWNSMVYNDINRINFNIKFKYDKRLHFKETINQYQGLQHKHIPQEVYNDLLEMIEKHGLCDHTKTDAKEKFAKLRKEHITMFLSESDHAIYYEDKQLIYSKITSHPCPNIQRFEKGLFSDFEQLVEVFLQLPDDKVDRKNFLNTHYVLRQLLRKRGVIVPEHDLNIIKTPARIRAHDDIYQMCCERLGWNFEPLG